MGIRPNKEQIISFLKKKAKLRQNEAYEVFQAISHLWTIYTTHHRTKKVTLECSTPVTIYRFRLKDKVRVCLLVHKGELLIFHYDRNHSTDSCRQIFYKK